MSASDFASEIIIVDTGSTDRTMEIARSFGARVKHFSWINDFAVARNVSIKEATSEWIFWLDADDRLSPDNLNRLKQALVSGQADVYSSGIVSQGAELEGACTTALHWRLFRNHLGLRFRYPLHEDLDFATAQIDITAAHTNITIEHTGYTLDREKLQAKAQRNLTIIQQCLAQNPNDLHWRYHQAVSLSLLGKYAQAAEGYEAVLDNPPASLSKEVDLYQAYISLAAAYVKMNYPYKAQEIFNRALKVFPYRRHLAITVGMFYLDQDEPEQAVTLLKQAKSLSSHSDDLGHAWPDGILETYLGQAYLLMGDLHQATFGKPRPGEWVKLATARLLKTGKTRSAERLCRLALAENKNDKAAQNLLNLLTEQPHGPWFLLTGLTQTLLTSPHDFVASNALNQWAIALGLSSVELLRHHGDRLLSQGNYLPAAETFSLIVSMVPYQAEGYKSLAVALRALGREDDALIAWQVGQTIAHKKEVVVNR